MAVTATVRACANSQRAQIVARNLLHSALTLRIHNLQSPFGPVHSLLVMC